MRAALPFLLLLSAAPMPDLLPPGHKAVQHDLILTWDESLGDHTFVAYPTRGFHASHAIEPDVPFRFSSKYSTRIYAAPTGAPLPESREEWLEVEWPSAPVPVREVRTIVTNSPVARVETKLRVTGVGDDGPEFERVWHRQFDSRGVDLGALTWLPLALIAATGAVMLLVLDRRNRARSSEPT